MSSQSKQPRTVGVNQKLANVGKNEMRTRPSEVITMLHVSSECSLTRRFIAGRFHIHESFSSLNVSTGIMLPKNSGETEWEV